MYRCPTQLHSSVHHAIIVNGNTYVNIRINVRLLRHTNAQTLAGQLDEWVSEWVSRVTKSSLLTLLSTTVRYTFPFHFNRVVCRSIHSFIQLWWSLVTPIKCFSLEKLRIITKFVGTRAACGGAVSHDHLAWRHYHCCKLDCKFHSTGSSSRSELCN